MDHVLGDVWQDVVYLAWVSSTAIVMSAILLGLYADNTPDPIYLHIELTAL